MKDTYKIIKIIYRIVTVIVIIVGLGFSYLIAKLDDAPGFVILGSAITLAGASVIYGIGEIIIYLKKNNELLISLTKK